MKKQSYQRQKPRPCVQCGKKMEHPWRYVEVISAVCSQKYLDKCKGKRYL